MGSNGEPRRLASHQLALAIGALLIALVAGLAVTSALVLRKSEIQVWEGQMRNASLLLAEHVNQTTASAFMALDLLAERVRASASRVSDEREYQRVVGAREMFDLLRDMIEGFRQIDVATIVAADGQVLNFTRSYPPPPKVLGLQV